jgi:hypothetical protein
MAGVPTSGEQERTLAYLATALDATAGAGGPESSHPAARSVGAEPAFPGPGAPLAGLTFGSSVVAVVRLLLAEGVPWLVAIGVKIWPAVIADRVAGRGVREIALDIFARWQAGEFGDRPSTP